MKILLIFSFIALGQWTYAAPETQEVKETLLVLIEPLLQQNTVSKAKIENQFSIKNCEKYKINIQETLLLGQSVNFVYKFKPGCDIEGVVTPKILAPFAIDLKLRNLPSFERLKSENRITAELEEKPILNLSIRSGELTGPKGKLAFEADYAVRIDPMKKKNMLDKNLGGEIRISEIFGKKVTLKEKILIQ
jgi:hypothetical protein